MLQLLAVGAGESRDRRVGARVLDRDGRRVGEVVAVHAGDCYVVPAPDLRPDARDRLGWTGDGPHRLRDEHVADAAPDAVQLTV